MHLRHTERVRLHFQQVTLSVETRNQRRIELLANFETYAHLHDVGRQAGAAVGIKVGQRGSHRRGRDSARDAQGHHTPPRPLALHELRCEVGVYEEIGKARVADVSTLDVVEERCADDAASLPDAGALPEVHAPLEVLGRGLDEIHALQKTRMGEQYQLIAITTAAQSEQNHICSAEIFVN